MVDEAEQTIKDTATTLKASWNDLLQYFNVPDWLVILVGILTITAVIYVAQRVVLQLLHDQLVKRNRIWLESFIGAATSPIGFFVWVTGTTLTITTLMGAIKLYPDLIVYIFTFKSTLLTLSVGWFTIRLVSRVEHHLKDIAQNKEGLDEVTVEALAKLIKITAFVLTMLYFLSSFGVNLTGLLAFGGVGGMVIGFAAKDILGNILGGLMLYLDKPFKVGDWIRSPDKEIEGTVEVIGWRITTVRTFDKRPLYVPNGIFATVSIENPSRMTHRRIKETMGVRYCDIDNMKKIINDVKEMLQKHDDIDETQTLIVNFDDFAASSLNFFIYTFTKTVNWIEYHSVKEDVLLKIADIVANNGSEMAFPTRTIHVEHSNSNEINNAVFS